MRFLASHLLSTYRFNPSLEFSLHFPIATRMQHVEIGRSDVGYVAEMVSLIDCFEVRVREEPWATELRFLHALEHVLITPHEVGRPQDSVILFKQLVRVEREAWDTSVTVERA